jgi:hypothetical protein
MKYRCFYEEENVAAQKMGRHYKAAKCQDLACLRHFSSYISLHSSLTRIRALPVWPRLGDELVARTRVPN